MAPSKMLFGAVLTALLATAAVPAQSSRAHVHSRPALPSDDALRRLNLTMAWRAAVPMAGPRDKLLRVEIDGKDLFVLTYSGMVMCLDAETGAVRWRERIGKPYTLLPYLAANTRGLGVIANVTLYGLDRKTGQQGWNYRLQAGVSAPPIADDEQIYVPGSDGGMYAYYLPFVTETPGGTTSLVYSDRVLKSEIRPLPVWEAKTELSLAFRPLQTAETLFVIGPSGQAKGFSKVLRPGQASTEMYRFATDGRVAVAPGQFGDTAYVGSDDGAMYAVNLANGKLRWRFVAGASISRRPIALDKDVFVTNRRLGMARIDRESGDVKWKVPAGRRVLVANRQADQFLAANGKYVYANDFSGRLVVLDRNRGALLSRLDTSDFAFPVINEVTDRLYLAANDGLIVCLHDREQTTPIRHRARLEEASSPTRKILETAVNEKGGKNTTLRDFLAQLRIKYKLRFVIAEQAFKQVGMANVQDRDVTPPNTEDKPLRDHLQRTLSQLNSTYLLRDDSILIIPGKPQNK